MRATIRAALLADYPLTAWLRSRGAAEAVIQGSTAADTDQILTRPHLILRFGSKDPGVGTVDKRNLTVWVHDEPGDYGLIDNIVNRVRFILTGIEARPTDDGKWISCIKWLGDDDDAYDDGPGTAVRASNYLIVGSGG